MQNITTHIRKEAIGNATANGVINGGVAWYMSKNQDELFVWGAGGIVADFVYTTLILVFLLSLIVLPLQRKKLSKFHSLANHSGVNTNRILLWLSKYKDPMKSLILACAAACVALPILIVVFTLASNAGYSPAHFTAFKAIYTAILAATIVPILVRVTIINQLSIEKIQGDAIG